MKSYTLQFNETHPSWLQTSSPSVSYPIHFNKLLILKDAIKNHQRFPSMLFLQNYPVLSWCKPLHFVPAGDKPSHPYPRPRGDNSPSYHLLTRRRFVLFSVFHQASFVTSGRAVLPCWDLQAGLGRQSSTSVQAWLLSALERQPMCGTVGSSSAYSPHLTLHKLCRWASLLFSASLPAFVGLLRWGYNNPALQCYCKSNKVKYMMLST